MRKFLLLTVLLASPTLADEQACSLAKESLSAAHAAEHQAFSDVGGIIAGRDDGFLCDPALRPAMAHDATALDLEIKLARAVKTNCAQDAHLAGEMDPRIDKLQSRLDRVHASLGDIDRVCRKP